MPVPADLASVAAVVIHEQAQAEKWTQLFMGDGISTTSTVYFPTYNTLSVPFHRSA